MLTVNRSLTQLSKKRGGPRLEVPKRKKSVREIELPAPLVTELRQWKLAARRTISISCSSTRSADRPAAKTNATGSKRPASERGSSR